MARHMTIEQLPYGRPVQNWLKDRYGETEANQIWEQTQQNYKNYLPDYGGNSDVCDYLVVGSDNPMAAEYVTVSDEQGFLVSRKRLPENLGG